MSISDRELWLAIHGMLLGGLFLLAFSGGMAELWSLRSEWLTAPGVREHLRRLRWGTGSMAVFAWLTCLTGTYLVYPWYRAAPPAGSTHLAAYPRSYLLANPGLAEWHRFGMEWKEHIGWLSPMLATAVAYIVWRYGPQMAADRALRDAVEILFVLAFATAAVAGILGAIITKVAPLH